MASPKTPLRADHRYLQATLSSLLGGKVEPMPADFDLIARVFQRAGGSWMRIFHGSPEDITLLKLVVKRAFKNDRLTKAPVWGS